MTAVFILILATIVLVVVFRLATRYPRGGASTRPRRSGRYGASGTGGYFFGSGGGDGGSSGHDGGGGGHSCGGSGGCGGGGCGGGGGG